MKLKFCLTVLFALILNASPQSIAQVPTSTAPSSSPKIYDEPPVKFVTEQGKPMTVTWPDGRQAEVMSYFSDPTTLTMPIEITENLCNDHFGIPGSLILAFRLGGFSLVWTQHPDKSKIGNMVKEFDNAISVDFMLDQTITKFYPNLGKSIPLSEITTSDYSWLPNGTKNSPPDSTYISLWNSEYLESNGETGVSENHAASGAMGVELKKSDHNSIEISSIKNLLGQNGYDGFNLLGDTISLFVRDAEKNNSLCQITLKVNQAPGINQYNSALAEAKKKQTPYIFSDDLWNFAGSLRRSIHFFNSLYQVGEKKTYTEADVQ